MAFDAHFSSFSQRDFPIYLSTSATFRSDPTAPPRSRDTKEAADVAPVRVQTRCLEGEFAPGWRLIHQMEVAVWENGTDGFLAAEDVFQNYGIGPTPEAALDDLKKSLAEYCTLIRAHAGNSEMDRRQSLRLAKYIQTPIP